MRMGLLLVALAGISNAAAIVWSREEDLSSLQHATLSRTHYAVVNIVVPHSKASAAVKALSNSGYVVGSVEFSAADNNQRLQSFLFRRGQLATIPGIAIGVNSAGRIAINENIHVDIPGDVTASHAFLWRDGSRHRLPISSTDRGSLALAINDRTYIVGAVLTARHAWKACMWRAGQLVNLAPQSASSRAVALNNRDQALVVSIDTAHARGVNRFQYTPMLWSQGRFLSLGGLQMRWETRCKNVTGAVPENYFLNNQGQALIQYTRWERGVPGPTLIQLWRNGKWIRIAGLDDANGLNDQGQIVGDGAVTGSYKNRALIWENGRVRDLNDQLPSHSGWILNNAKGINDQGQIIGEGKYHGKECNFLMTPV